MATKTFQLLIILIADCINFETIILTHLHLTGLEVLYHKTGNRRDEFINIFVKTCNAGINSAITRGEEVVAKNLVDFQRELYGSDQNALSTGECDEEIRKIEIMTFGGLYS